MAEVTLAILLFIAILGITTLICGMWVFYKFMRVFGQVIGAFLRTGGRMLRWLVVDPRTGRPVSRVVTADGVYSLARAGHSAGAMSPRNGSAPQAPDPLVAGMVRCGLARCLAVNPDEAAYCRRCGHLLARQPQASRRPMVALSSA